MCAMATWESSTLTTLKDTKQPLSRIITPLTQLQRLHTQVFLILNVLVCRSLSLYVHDIQLLHPHCWS